MHVLSMRVACPPAPPPLPSPLRYSNTLASVVLAGPTLFSQIIQHASAVAASSGCTQESQKYFVLLIITDGVCSTSPSLPVAAPPPPLEC